jgi:hypothetical protein
VPQAEGIEVPPLAADHSVIRSAGPSPSDKDEDQEEDDEDNGSDQASVASQDLPLALGTRHDGRSDAPPVALPVTVEPAVFWPVQSGQGEVAEEVAVDTRAEINSSEAADDVKPQLGLQDRENDPVDDDGASVKDDDDDGGGNGDHGLDTALGRLARTEARHNALKKRMTAAGRSGNLEFLQHLDGTRLTSRQAKASKEVVQTIVDPAVRKVGSTSWNDFALSDQEKLIGRVKRNLPDVYFGTDDWQAVRLIIRRLSTLKYALFLSLPAVVRGKRLSVTLGSSFRQQKKRKAAKAA